MKEKICKILLKELEEKGDLFFTEVEEVFEKENFDYKGEKSLTFNHNKNLIVWTGWNQEAIEIIEEILKEDCVDAYSCNPIEVVLHSNWLNFPVAKGINYKYVKPHWLPAKIVWVKKKRRK